MKKFLLMLLSVMMMSVAFAQPHQQTTKLTDNWFVGLNVGYVAPLDHSFDLANHSGFDAYCKQIGVEVGRWITPVFGLGVNYQALGNINHSKTWADMGNVLVDGHVNMSNLLAGYNTRKWEVEFIPSVGFAQYYGNVTPNNHRFFAMMRAAIGVNYNVNDAWAIYLKPGIQYVDRLRHYNGMFDVRLGVNYYLKNHDGNHRMTMCENIYTERDYKSLKTKYDKLLDSKPNVIREVVHDTIIVPFSVNESIYFTFDSFELPDNGIVVTGYASEEGTKEHNDQLCLDRANAVKNALVKKGFDSNKIEVKVGGTTTKFGPNLEDNRVVTITTK